MKQHRLKGRLSHLLKTGKNIVAEQVAVEIEQKHLESAKARLLEEEYQELEYRLKIAV